MELDEVRVGQRVRVNVPGVGDHGQVGTIKKLRNGNCYIHLDRDQRSQRLVMFFPQDLDPIPDELLPAR